MIWRALKAHLLVALPILVSSIPAVAGIGLTTSPASPSVDLASAVARGSEADLLDEKHLLAEGWIKHLSGSTSHTRASRANFLLQTEQNVRFYLRNNRGWFRSVTLICYLPATTKPQVDSRTLIPWQRMSLNLPVGTKVYIASQEQIRLINEGKDIRENPPSLTVRENDEEQEYPIFR